MGRIMAYQTYECVICGREFSPKGIHDTDVMVCPFCKSTVEGRLAMAAREAFLEDCQLIEGELDATQV
jgi:DNA-directed RNA polymerase subunit RPC12/RpoP